MNDFINALSRMDKLGKNYQLLVNKQNYKQKIYFYF